MRNQLGEFKRLDTTGSEKTYRHEKRGHDRRNQLREIHTSDRFGSDEMHRRVMEGL